MEGGDEAAETRDRRGGHGLGQFQCAGDCIRAKPEAMAGCFFDRIVSAMGDAVLSAGRETAGPRETIERERARGGDGSRCRCWMIGRVWGCSVWQWTGRK